MLITMNREYDWCYLDNNKVDYAKWECNPKETKENAHSSTNMKPTEGYNKEANIGSARSRPRRNQWGTTLAVCKGYCARNICVQKKEI
jgi:hypothetical protein